MSRRNPKQEFSDAPIKLFGRSIQLSDSNSPPSAPADSADASSSADTADGYAVIETKKELGNGIAGESHKEDGKPLEKSQAFEDVEDTDVKIHEQRVDKSDPGSDKVLKKPDKVISCPRCHSMETKFCYFNNYNVNQPRHFCKSCQRYWTAGGTIRNVPIGAGRRKNKQIATQFPPLVISSNGAPMTHMNLLNAADPCGVSSAGLGSPIGFPMETKEICQNGNDPPLCNSVAALLSLHDQKIPMENASNPCKEGFAPPSSSSSSAPKEVLQIGQIGSSGSQISPLSTLQGYSGPPPYPWNMGWTPGMAYNADEGYAVLVPCGSFQPMATAPGFCGPTPDIIPLVPNPYWNWDSNSWNLQTNNLSPSSSAGNSSSGNTSPLGKHPRDLNSQAEEATEKYLWVPKTLRIDDPDDAAKSSIWTTLGIKPGDREPFSKGKPLKELLRKSEGDDGVRTLQANPAALSRFKAFQEST